MVNLRYIPGLGAVALVSMFALTSSADEGDEGESCSLEPPEAGVDLIADWSVADGDAAQACQGEVGLRLKSLPGFAHLDHVTGAARTPRGPPVRTGPGHLLYTGERTRVRAQRRRTDPEPGRPWSFAAFQRK